MDQRTKATKPAATGMRSTRFAWVQSRPVGRGAAAAVICFEFLQRPENVWPVIWLGRTTGARKPRLPRDQPPQDRRNRWHPLETYRGRRLSVLRRCRGRADRLPRRGVAMILKRGETARPSPTLPCRWRRSSASFGSVRAARDLHARCLPAWRHDGIRGSRADGRSRPRALGPPHPRLMRATRSGLFERALPATRKRRAHALANVQGTSIQNAPPFGRSE